MITVALKKELAEINLQRISLSVYLRLIKIGVWLMASLPNTPTSGPRQTYIIAGISLECPSQHHCYNQGHSPYGIGTLL